MNGFAWIRSDWFAPLAVLAALILLAGGYWPALGMIGDLQARIASQRETLARLNSEIAVRQAGIGSSDGRASPFTADFLAGGSESLVVAGLQNRLRDLAIAHNVDLNSANNLPLRTESGVTYLGLHLIVRGEIKDIQQVLHVIETGRPLLFVSRANLRLDSWPITSNDPARNGQPALVAELDVFGAMLPTSIASENAEASTDFPGGSPASAPAAPSFRGRR
jgi:hypothetical protein